jgi:RNA polymerase sigma factor (sigma-70 family)
VMEATSQMWENWSNSIVDSAAGPEDLVLRKERIAHIEQGLARLTQLQRECFFLRIEGFQYKEIGALLKVGTSTVSSSLRNAINNLLKGAS